MKVYPVCLVGLEQRLSVVVGGGQVAARKVEALLEADARVVVISPAIAPELQRRCQAGQIQVVPRPYRAGDLAGAFLVVVATDDPAVNRAAWQEAMRRACLVNVADDPAHSNFILPAVLRRGEITIAVSTGGASPALARHLREQLESWIGAEYGELAELLAELRPALLTRLDSEELRLAAIRRLVSPATLDLLRRAGPAAARQYALDLLTESDQRLAEGDRGADAGLPQANSG
jgi:precorrin-2 dehydrogenase/sirohydrochlorin ferrochelatase